MPIISPPDKTKLVTNRIEKSDEKVYDIGATYERNGPMFWVTGKPTNDNARTKFKKQKNTKVKSINAENISEKQVLKLQNKPSKSRSISTPDSRLVKPIFSHHKKIYSLAAAPTTSQQLHESYTVSAYL